MMAAGMAIPYIAEFSYLAIFVVILLNSSGFLPIPEEIILLIIGCLVFENVFSFWPAVLVALISVLVVDNIHFYLASHGHSILRRFISRKLMARVQKAVDLHGPYAVFFARFIPGTRVVTAWVAGTSGMRQKKFFFADFFSAAIQIIALVWVGKALGPQVEKAFHFVYSLDAAIPIILMILFVMFAIIVCLFRKTIRNFILEVSKRD
ncbi:MAG: VTT domain-containing protein [Candidatus Woesearchaeota archaeon]